MRLLASRTIFRGNCQAAVMVDNSFRRMCCRKALRRLACEGRRWASSQGESLRLQSCWRLRSHAHNSTSVCIRRFRLYAARLAQMLRTCCWPYTWQSTVCHPRRCPARLAILSLFLPYLRGRPRERRWPRLGFGGRSRRAASLRRRPTTTSLGIFRMVDYCKQRGASVGRDHRAPARIEQDG